jgi:hypothetical protein
MPMADRIPRARPMSPRPVALVGVSERVGTSGARARRRFPARSSAVTMGASVTPLPEVPT